MRLGRTQRRVLGCLQDAVGTHTTATIATALGLTDSQAKHALTRLHKSGLVMVTRDGHRKRWHLTPSSVLKPTVEEDRPASAPFLYEMPLA